MATGRTISASFLTEKDKKVFSLCESVSKSLIENVPKEKRDQFVEEFAKLSKETRDGGAGRGGGKLERDALCTRGRQGKAPFSNRNLRWHPLVVVESLHKYAKEIERIEIEGEDDNQVLVFVIKEKRREIKYKSDKVHELPERYAVLPKHWIAHINRLKHWNDTLWTQNSCVIPSLEACEWWDAVETYALLGIIMATEVFGAKFNKTYSDAINILKKQKVDRKVKLPSKNFPKKDNEILNCPMCKTSILKNPANLSERERISTWQPAWRSKKREEGEDSSVQIMHVVPLVENELRHNAKNVRYGHRWCNVAMTDHSLDETLDFMEYIVKVHKRCK